MAKKSYIVSIETDMCKACGYCEEMCPKDVFEQTHEFNKEGYEAYRVAHTENCIGCLSCIATCPDFAVTVKLAETEAQAS